LLHVSGVLAVVATGLYLGWEAPEALNSTIRLEAKSFWDIIIYLLNGIVFVLIGLQLPGILRSMAQHWWPMPLVYAIVICVICILVRLVWIIPGAYLPRLLFKRIRDREEPPDLREVIIVGWAGMRGIVSLAAALALHSYPNFPRPHLVQFISFCVIFTTLVLQGLTLPALIRFLGVGDDGISAREEIQARQQLAAVVFEKINAVRVEEKFPPSALAVVENVYRERALILQDELADELGWSDRRHHVLSVRRLNRLMIAAQRRALVALRREGAIGDDVLHKIERELDLEEVRLKA